MIAKRLRKGKIMANITEKFPVLNSANVDPRTRRYLTPKRIVQTSGSVTNSEYLLVEKDNQITLDVGDTCVLENKKGEPNASVLVDFGMEFAGSARIMIGRVKGKKSVGDAERVDIRVRFGESVSEALNPIGVKNSTNDHAIRDSVYNVGFLSATETNESGYRFAYIELLEPEGMVQIKAIQGVFHYLDIDYAGSFECSDEKLNRIWNTAAYTVHLNMQEYLWDGVKRDRLVWIGDMYTEVKTILSVFGNQPIIRRSLDLIAGRTPNGEYMNGIAVYSIWWVLIHYELYCMYGDKEYLSSNKSYLKYIMQHLNEAVDENGCEHIAEGQWRFLDWSNNDNPTAVHAGLQGMIKIALDRGAKLLCELGESSLAEECSATANKMYSHIPECGGSKQAAAFMALSGIADPKKMNDEIIAPTGAHGYSTFLGYHILSAKAEAGDYQGAIDDMKAYWGGMLDMGATTFWEDFHISWLENAAPIDAPVPEGKVDIHGDKGDYCYVGLRHSLCHGWASGPCPYMTNYILGINAVSPDTYKISPNLANLEYAKGSIPTKYGVIYVEARKVDGEVKLTVDAPKEITVL